MRVCVSDIVTPPSTKTLYNDAPSSGNAILLPPVVNFERYSSNDFLLLLFAPSMPVSSPLRGKLILNVYNTLL